MAAKRKKGKIYVVVASKQIFPKVDTEKTEQIFMPREQNAGQHHNIKTADASFTRVRELKYLGKTLANEN
jgi:hypothetical protein